MTNTIAVAQPRTDDSGPYAGSRFADVVDAINANPYQGIWGASGEPPLPVHEVTLRTVVGGLASFGFPKQFRTDSMRTLDSAVDLRWGAEGKGFPRLVHPNGVCLTGRWTIDADTPCSGYFATGSSALIVGRYSTCCTETRRGHTRSLSLVGKLFPTTDPYHLEPLRTANFFTQEDIGGANTEFINDAELRNAPDTTVANRGAGVPLLITVGLVFRNVDQRPSMRQLYPIAELGKADGTPTRAPEFMRLMVAPEQPKIPGGDLDFRDEVTAQIHFSHPTWRTDRNDPATATRVGGRKVR